MNEDKENLTEKEIDSEDQEEEVQDLGEGNDGTIEAADEEQFDSELDAVSGEAQELERDEAVIDDNEGVNNEDTDDDKELNSERVETDLEEDLSRFLTNINAITKKFRKLITPEEEEAKEEETFSEEEEAARIERQLRDLKRNQIEAALYASGKPLSIEILSTKLEISKTEVEELINELAFDYLERSTALVIAQMGDRYQMQIKHEYSEKVSKFAEGGAIAEKYLRTLTIIALKQPIMKSLLIKLRGSGAYEHVKYLEDEGLIESKKKGRSAELMTTDKYAEMFGLPKDKEEMKRMMIAQLNLEDQ